MQVKYNITGARRKDMVKAVAAAIGCDSKYLGAPTFAYKIGDFTITRNGYLEFSDRTDSKLVEMAITALNNAGFEAETTTEIEPAAAETESKEATTETETEITAAETDTFGLEISISRSILTDTQLDNLKKLIASKEGLIKAALGTDRIPIEVTEDKITFPWFHESDSESVTAYNLFITKMCEMAKTQKRVTAKAKKVDNEKYAFRCFLLRLGFIGEEYKAARKILLKNLNGSSAFKVPKENAEERDGETV